MRAVALKDILRSIHGMMNQLAVVAVITVFCGIFIFPMFYDTKSAKSVKAEIAALGKALTDYHAETGAWPASTGGRSVTDALGGAGGGKVYSKHERRDPEGRFTDPWDTPFRYFFSSTSSYAVQSAGPDGKFEKGLSEGDDYWYAP